MSDFSIIDTMMHGYDGITGAFLVSGERTALVETGPKSAVDNVIAGLKSLGVDSLDWIVVTHIHLDHAGAAGTLAARFPDARVAVHEVGAPHLVDPQKLWASAARIYGADMERLWGGIDPISEERITVVADGEEIDLGGRSLTALETPGHAYHHHAYLDSGSGTLFTGDALGVRLQNTGVIRPATPPPEFHLAKAISSIELIRHRRPAALCPTHFGPVDVGLDDVCDEAVDALQRWAGWVKEARSRTSDLDEAAALVTEKARADLGGRVSDEAERRMEQTTSYWMNTWGYMRYLDKETEAKAG